MFSEKKICDKIAFLSSSTSTVNDEERKELIKASEIISRNDNFNGVIIYLSKVLSALDKSSIPSERLSVNSKELLKEIENITDSFNASEDDVSVSLSYPKNQIQKKKDTKYKDADGIILIILNVLLLSLLFLIYYNSNSAVTAVSQNIRGIAGGWWFMFVGWSYFFSIIISLICAWILMIVILILSSKIIKKGANPLIYSLFLVIALIFFILDFFIFIWPWLLFIVIIFQLIEIFLLCHSIKIRNSDN